MHVLEQHVVADVQRVQFGLELVEDEHLIQIGEEIGRVERVFFLQPELILLVEALTLNKTGLFNIFRSSYISFVFYFLDIRQK